MTCFERVSRLPLGYQYNGYKKAYPCNIIILPTTEKYNYFLKKSFKKFKKYTTRFSPFYNDIVLQPTNQPKEKGGQLLMDNKQIFETITENMEGWKPPEDLSQVIESYISDCIEFDICQDAERVRNGSPLLWSAVCVYVGSHLLPLSPLFSKSSLQWYNRSGADRYINELLKLFIYFALLYNKPPRLSDFFHFSGVDHFGGVNSFAVWNESIPTWLQNAINTIKEAEKQALEGMLTSKQYATSGVLAILQNGYGYNGSDTTLTIENRIITAESLPFFGDIAQ